MRHYGLEWGKQMVPVLASAPSSKARRWGIQALEAAIEDLDRLGELREEEPKEAFLAWAREQLVGIEETSAE